MVKLYFFVISRWVSGGIIRSVRDMEEEEVGNRELNPQEREMGWTDVGVVSVGKAV